MGMSTTANSMAHRVNEVSAGPKLLAEFEHGLYFIPLASIVDVKTQGTYLLRVLEQENDFVRWEVMPADVLYHTLCELRQKPTDVGRSAWAAYLGV